ncbi:DUF4333 domain-containing protein [Mycobacterium seoulense]|uniref:DUF4333 domain-containing protein n=1 Tax=Mycobacterium seoulense TaxID=386911 RepID=UPI003CEE42A1
MQPQQPRAPRQYPQPPAGPPPISGPCHEPPTRPLPRPFPMGRPHPPLPHPRQHPRPGENFWAPTTFAPHGPRSAARRRLPLYLGAGITVAAAAVAIPGLWAPGFFVTKQLDVAAVQAGVAHVLSDPAGYGARNVGDVSCNDGQNPTVTKGGSFTCQATIDHLKHQFVVTFTDDTGSYQVSAAKGTKI